MKIQYLGTAAAEALPAPFCKCSICENARKVKGKEIRTRSQAVIDDVLVMDYPCDTYDHMIRFGLNMCNVGNVLLTHSHSDHFCPEEIILRRPDVATGLEGKLHIHGNATNQGAYEMAIKNERRRYHSFKDYQEYHILQPFQSYHIGAYEVTPLKANHDIHEECLLYLISDGTHTIFYANDSGMFPEETWKALEGRHVDAVGFDCTMLKLERVFNHMNLDDAEETRKRLYDMGCADENTKFVLTHFSHNGGMTHQELEEYGEAHNFLIAYDGFTLRL